MIGTIVDQETAEALDAYSAERGELAECERYEREREDRQIPESPEMETPKIQTAQELEHFRASFMLRADWHEPDEQGITALVRGRTFDNAGTPNELVVEFQQLGCPLAQVNLATLCSWACRA